MGDTNMCTDNPVLLRNTHNDRTIICAQRKAAKVVPTEENIIEANKLAFNDDIGTITNYVTSMFDVQAGFEKGSDEYKELDYRIKCGQLMQQNSIDRAKGIIAKPMPEYWYSYRAIDKMDPKAELNEKIAAAYKPYFMTYVYPALRSSHIDYLHNNDDDARRKFRKYKIRSVKELMCVDNQDQDVINFLEHYNTDKKIGCNHCVINRICWLFENEFPTTAFAKRKQPKFDYSILKSNVEYSTQDYYKILELFNDYERDVASYMQHVRIYGTDDDFTLGSKDSLKRKFRMSALQICSNEYELCDILLDICYRSEKSKQFVWDVSGSTIIDNLLRRNEFRINYPEHGVNEFMYQGEPFSMRTLDLNGGQFANSIE